MASRDALDPGLWRARAMFQNDGGDRMQDDRWKTTNEQEEARRSPREIFERLPKEDQADLMWAVRSMFVWGLGAGALLASAAWWLLS